jgi:hypothetical protein
LSLAFFRGGGGVVFFHQRRKASRGGCSVKRDERGVHLVRVFGKAFRVERAHGNVSRRGVRHGRDCGVGVRGDERHEFAAFAAGPAKKQNLLVPGGNPFVAVAAEQKPARFHLQPTRRGVPRALHFEHRRGCGDSSVDAAVLRVQSIYHRAVHAARQSGDAVRARVAFAV